MTEGKGRTAVVLCGGKSSRLGMDKAMIEVGGRTLLARAIETAGAVASQVLLSVGPGPRYLDYGLPIVTDSVPDQGPLAGILAGLDAATHETFVVLAVDLPFVTPEAIERMLRELSGYELVMPRSNRGLEPLCSAGLRTPCHAAARKLIAAGNPVVHALMNEVRSREVSFINDTGFFDNVNTSADLDRVHRTWPG